MPHLVTDMFHSSSERDVYYKMRDDVGKTFERVLKNFLQGPVIPSGVLTPAIVALAWVLRSAILPVRTTGSEEAYQLLLTMARTILEMPEVSERGQLK